MKDTSKTNTTTRRKVICLCGDDTYTKTVNDKGELVWKCLNCRKETPRKTRNASRKFRKQYTLDDLRAAVAECGRLVVEKE
jgi:hypothetical protein